MKRRAEKAKEFEFSVNGTLMDQNYQFHLSIISMYSH